MKHQLKKVFGNLNLSVSSNRVPSTYVKLEPTEEAYEATHLEGNDEVLYGQYKGSRGRKFSNHVGCCSDPRSRGGVFKRSVSNGLPRKNPNNPDGSLSTCILYGSVYHWARLKYAKPKQI